MNFSVFQVLSRECLNAEVCSSCIVKCFMCPLEVITSTTILIFASNPKFSGSTKSSLFTWKPGFFSSYRIFWNVISREMSYSDNKACKKTLFFIVKQICRIKKVLKQQPSRMKKVFAKKSFWRRQTSKIEFFQLEKKHFLFDYFFFFCTFSFKPW